MLGFAHKDCLDALKARDGDETLALEHLMQGLADKAMPDAPEDFDSDEAEEMRAMERESLKAIVGNAFTWEKADETCTYRVRLDCKGVPGKTFLEAYIHANSCYPEAPVLAVVRNDDLPAYVRLSILKELREQCLELSGELSLYELVSWANEHIPTLSKTPPPLSSLKSFDVKEETEIEVPVKGQRRSKKHGRQNKHPRDGAAESKRLYNAYLKRKDDSRVKAMREKRSNLPASKFREKIIKCIHESQVIVMS